jgi:hypothetical protein
MSVEQTEFEFPHPEEEKENLEIEVEAVEGRTNVLEKQEEEEETPTNIEVVDDTPPEDQNRIPSEPPEDLTEEELNGYSHDKFKNRIKHFSKGYHDERRAKEEAQRERVELEKWAKGVQEENESLKGSVSKSQATLLEQAKKTVTSEVEEAKRRYKEAYESGDPDGVVAAQDQLTTAKIRMDKVNSVKLPSLQPQQNKVQVPESNAPTLDPKTEAWAKDNTWFGSDDEMTAFSLGVHQKLEKEGITPQGNPALYYERVDARMRQVFPDNFGDTQKDKLAEPTTKKRSSNVVSPVTRSTSPNTIRLSETQVRVAKRLGVPLELYAQKVAEEMRKDNG